ncbi:hypothetical protein ACH5RR_007015 [Cinchona calisaya]|uniref:Uncharacterized protein n=1 Tax=Cinchona calisaya TaxID=153742 RepID=A0ABD3AR29_9GENT
METTEVVQMVKQPPVVERIAKPVVAKSMVEPALAKLVVEQEVRRKTPCIEGLDTQARSPTRETNAEAVLHSNSSSLNCGDLLHEELSPKTVTIQDSSAAEVGTVLILGILILLKFKVFNSF